MQQSCQIAIEHTPIRIYQSDKGAPDGKDGVLFVAVPVIHDFLSKNKFNPDQLIASLLAELSRCSQNYELKKIDHKKSTTKDFIIQYYQRVSEVTHELSTAWRPDDIAYAYVVRSSGAIEVYERETNQQLHDDLSAFNPHLAERIVLPDNPSASKCTVLN